MTQIRLLCDDCMKSSFPVDDWVYPDTLSVDLRRHAARSGWTDDGGRDLCRACTLRRRQDRMGGNQGGDDGPRMELRMERS